MTSLQERNLLDAISVLTGLHEQVGDFEFWHAITGLYLAGEIDHSSEIARRLCGRVDLRELMTSNQVATYLGVGLQTLAKWRYGGGGPKYVKVGRRVRYQKADVAAWLESKRRASTAPPLPRRVREGG